MTDIPYYNDYVSPSFLSYLLATGRPVVGVPQLMEVGAGGGLESQESLHFLCELYELIKDDLNQVLSQRINDRHFIDQQTKACFDFNKLLKRDYSSPDYKTIIGFQDAKGRIVIGPKNDFYCKRGAGKPIAAIPQYLLGNHVTLFGPPDDTKLSINAMNAYHRKLKDEPAVIGELLKDNAIAPFWGADDEDSKTPLRSDLIGAGVNLSECFDGTINYQDPKSNKVYQLENDHLSLPIKRFPGLALPSFFLFYKNNPMPLHLYDFALHLFKNWHNPKALAFYVPKLENEEEACYIKTMIGHAENLVKKIHPEYQLGTIRLMIVLENPRAVFRVNEIIDELHPYFVGASLGWHDYLASTARLFKEDANYRIPVKADPNIVIKYIKASHNLLAEVVGSRGGIKVGGMYGILPINTDLKSPSFQVTIKGYIKDVITQFKRDLSGFWVAHPDFVRIGIALVVGWKQYAAGDKSKLETLVTSLLDEVYHKEVLDFISGPDIAGLNSEDPLYQRSLLAAVDKESTFIANNHPDEIRYNVFQSLQYLTDWLSGNGCVALPAEINGIPVRVMDDLATAERSRWEVWHEINHQRFSITDFLKIAHEEMHFIRKDLSDSKKIVQVKWDERTEKWYPVALNLMIRLMTDKRPVEFATELLLPFTIEAVRAASDPWAEVLKIDQQKYKMDPSVIRFNYYFTMCGSLNFANSMAQNLTLDKVQAQNCIMAFSKADVLEAAAFHGDIGESKKTLDAMASNEQKLVLNEDQSIKNELASLGSEYKIKFGMKFLVSAEGRSGSELLAVLKTRLNNSAETELHNAKTELWKITNKRMCSHPINHLNQRFQEVLKKHNIVGASISISTGMDNIQTISLGESTKGIKAVNQNTWFELASLSKTVGSCFAIEYFSKKNISLNTPVNSLLAQSTSSFRIKSLDAANPEWAEQVTLAHLMSHSALNMHYVNGVPANQKMPLITELLEGNTQYDYPPVGVIHQPGKKFQYSGGGFLVLEHLLESMEGKSIVDLTSPFLKQLGMEQFSFKQETLPGVDYASGYTADNIEIVGSRKMFPAIAAGTMGSASDMNRFLHHLTKAFHQVQGSGPISHDTAVTMLHGKDLGCMAFMGTLMGLGVFSADAGPNRLAIHQGANDGFRCLYVHCYDGPDTGYGMTLLCNGELNGVLFNSEIAQILFSEFKMEGIDLSQFKSNFDIKNIQPEEIVNMGYKNLIFGAFLPTLPEEILEPGPLDPLANYNLAVDAKILEVSNQKFARAENLLSARLPVFDPELFGRQGKIMDSWETVRHNQGQSDILVFELKNASVINYVSLSTKYHLGNQVQFVKLEGQDFSSQQWIEILPKTELDGHSLKCIKLENLKAKFNKIKVSVYPDGGFSRLGLYADLPEEEKKNFLPLAIAKSTKFNDPIAKTLKPLAAPYAPDETEIQKNWAALKKGDEYDVANRAFGGKILSASNEHFGPAIQILSPFGPMHMFDGFESARSRIPGHQEEIIIQLAKATTIHRIEMDFTYFVNNNPLLVSLLGFYENKWVSLVAPTNVKAFAGNIKEFKISSDQLFEQIKVIAIPDGGINRVRVFARA